MCCSGSQLLTNMLGPLLRGACEIYLTYNITFLEHFLFLLHLWPVKSVILLFGPVQGFVKPQTTDVSILNRWKLLSRTTLSCFCSHLFLEWLSADLWPTSPRQRCSFGMQMCWKRIPTFVAVELTGRPMSISPSLTPFFVIPFFRSSIFPFEMPCNNMH